MFPFIFVVVVVVVVIVNFSSIHRERQYGVGIFKFPVSRTRTFELLLLSHANIWIPYTMGFTLHVTLVEERVVLVVTIFCHNHLNGDDDYSLMKYTHTYASKEGK